MKVLLRAVLFFDAVLNILLGLLMLVSPMSSLYSALQLPQPQPALYGQLLGVALVGLGWLLWQATLNGQLTVAVARTVGKVNLVSAVLIVAWALFLDLPTQGAAGKIWLGALAVVLLFFALVQIPAARRVHEREREQKQRKEELAAQKPAGRAPEAPATTNPESRREPVITPPPGYGPGTEVTSDPVPEDSAPVHHARQNPYP